MKEERLTVLRLLENGIINAQEAERLLNTLRPLPSEGKEAMNRQRAAFNEKITSAGESLAGLAKKAGKTVGQKTETVAKKAEPVLKRAAEKIGEKTEEVCTNAKNYVDKKKAERERSYVPDIDSKDVSDTSDAPCEDECFSQEPTDPSADTNSSAEENIEK